MPSPERATWNLDPTSRTLSVSGNWSLATIAEVKGAPFDAAAQATKPRSLRAEGLTRLDTSGALVMLQCALDCGAVISELSLEGFPIQHQKVLELVIPRFHKLSHYSPPEPMSLRQELGFRTLEGLKELRSLLSFVGEFFNAIWNVIRAPLKLRVRELVVQLEVILVDALIIAALMTLLIGVVIAYLFALQLQKYGANIFIVDGVALAMCRELSPVVIAVIIAGRSGSAFAAQLGTMKLNEEIDAMITLGLSPMQVLVIPRVFAMIIAMPLLAFLGDMAGILGGMLISLVSLEISPLNFIERLHINFPLKSFYIGLIKSPVFAIFIAIIGCRLGLNCPANARAVGLNTTAAVVQGIISIILLNSGFAILFSDVGW